MKRRNKNIVLYAALLLLSGTVEAQTVLTLDSCRSLALANNRQSLIAQEQEAKAAFDIKTYRANFLPRLTGQGLYLLSDADIKYHKHYNLLDNINPDDLAGLSPDALATAGLLAKYAVFDLDLQLKPNNLMRGGLRFEQPVFMGGKILTAYQMAQTGRDIAALNRQRTEAETLLKTDEAYWTFVKLREMQIAAKAYHQAVEQVVKDVQNGVETGLVNNNDLLKAKVKQGEALLKLREALNGQRLARMNLCMILGINLSSDIIPADTLTSYTKYDAVTMEGFAETDPSQRPEYQILTQQLKLKNQEVKLIRADYLPQIGISGGYNGMTGATLNGERLFDDASFSAMVSLKLPLFHWGEGLNRVRSAKADMNIANYQFQETSDMLRLEMTKAYNDIDEAMMKVSIAENAFAQAKDNLRIVNDRHELGLDNVATLLEAQALWQEAWLEFINAKTALKTTETAYLKAVGRLKR